MKTVVVPAQITTVEDRIAGSLTFPQIILLVMPLVIGAGIYAVMSPKLHFATIKLAIIIIQYSIFGLLALRFNGKIVADWLIIYLRYAIRPRRYIFTKNDPIHRDIVVEDDKITVTSEEQIAEQDIKVSPALSLPEQIKIDRLFDNAAVSISFKLPKKGGIDVALKQAKN